MFTHREENYILDTLKEIKEVIRSPTIKNLIKETHENNIMLRQIIAYLNKESANANAENDNDFIRNIMANLISSGFEFNNIRR